MNKDFTLARAAVRLSIPVAFLILGACSGKDEARAASDTTSAKKQSATPGISNTTLTPDQR